VLFPRRWKVVNSRIAPDDLVTLSKNFVVIVI
jgi:hypothetical protein